MISNTDINLISCVFVENFGWWDVFIDKAVDYHHSNNYNKAIHRDSPV